MMNEQMNDSVEREVLVAASIEEVFAGLTDPSRFPTWGPQTVEGTMATGSIVTLDFGPSGGGKVTVFVEEFNPPTVFAYRWAQGESDPAVLLEDPRTRPNTLVTFSLRTTEDGTVLKVVESGFQALAADAAERGIQLANVGSEMAGAGWALMLSALVRSFGGAETPVSDAMDIEKTVAAAPEVVFDLLVNPEKWWAAAVEGTVAQGETPLLDFGQFGRWRIFVEEVRPNEYLAFRRVQGTDDPEALIADPRTKPNSLVEFRLVPSGTGTVIHHRESGFDALPEPDREMYFRRWQQGWGIVVGLLEMHLGLH